MSVQKPLFYYNNQVPPANNGFTLINWNVRNPSLERAKRQMKWLLGLEANAIILTELKLSKGLDFMMKQFQMAGYEINCTIAAKKAYGTLIASYHGCSRPLSLDVNVLSSRFAAMTCPFKTPLSLIGLYVPSRGSKARRNVDKRLFQQNVVTALKKFVSETPEADLIVGGDLNVIERDHVPPYKNFGEWEYAFYESFLENGLIDAYRALHPAAHDHSWYGRTGNGYRFDHFFISKSLLPALTTCHYLHSPREEDLSDHSAMQLVLNHVTDEGNGTHNHE